MTYDTADSEATTFISVRDKPKIRLQQRCRSEVATFITVRDKTENMS